MLENEVDSRGPGIATAFRQPGAAHLSVRALERSSLTVTEIRVNRNGFGWTDPIPHADAAMLAVQLRAIPFHEAMGEGKIVPVYDILPNDTLFYDMRNDPRANVPTRSHSLHFVFPRSTLEEIAGAVEARGAAGSFPATGAKVRDRHLARLARAVLPALRAPDAANGLFVSHLGFALGIYACWRYAGLVPREQPEERLCSLRTKLATEYVAGNLNGGVELGELAALCGMPLRRFVRAFRETTGMAPYQWLMMRRLDLAKSELRRKGAVADLAIQCGFSSEAHFTTTFTRATGLTPSQWREMLS